MLVHLFVCLLVSFKRMGILMLFCCKLSAASASLAVKDFSKSVNVGQKYRQTHCIQFIGLHFRNIRSRSHFETLAENSWPLTSDVVSYIGLHYRLQQLPIQYYCLYNLIILY